MPTLRRILKYTPAVVLGLLVVAWVVSVWFPCGFSIRTPIHKSRYTFDLKWGNLWLLYDEWMVGEAIHDFNVFPLWISGRPEHAPYNKYLGKFEYMPISPMVGMPTKQSGRLRIPLATFLTAMLPLAIGPVISFRYRLWHYLAYTALIALELAYYLRW